VNDPWLALRHRSRANTDLSEFMMTTRWHSCRFVAVLLTISGMLAAGALDLSAIGCPGTISESGSNGTIPACKQTPACCCSGNRATLKGSQVCHCSHPQSEPIVPASNVPERNIQFQASQYCVTISDEAVTPLSSYPVLDSATLLRPSMLSGGLCLRHCIQVI